MTANQWRGLVPAAAASDALLLIGPGAEAELPTGLAQRHLPAGTVIPLAEGAQLAGPGRRVVVLGGDGDIYGPCLGALLHAARRNTAITCLVRENGLGAGSQPLDDGGRAPFRPLDLCRAAGAAFAAQADGPEASPSLAEAALSHPGFAILNVTAKEAWEQILYGSERGE